MYLLTVFPMLVVYGILIGMVQDRFLKLVMPLRRRQGKLSWEEIRDYKRSRNQLLFQGTGTLLWGVLIHFGLILIAIVAFVVIEEESFYEVFVDLAELESLIGVAVFMAICYAIAWTFMGLNFLLRGATALHTNQLHK